MNTATDVHPMQKEVLFLTFDCQMSKKTLNFPSTVKLANLSQMIIVGGEEADINGEEDETLNDGKEQKINVVHSFGLYRGIINSLCFEKFPRE